VQWLTRYLSTNRDKYKGAPLVNCKRYVTCLIRLPLFYELKRSQVRAIVAAVKRFYA
jgi:dTDP-4-amino-4,6-dideoxygalactose transaminase